MRKFRKIISFGMIAMAAMTLLSPSAWSLEAVDDSQIFGKWRFVAPPEIRTDHIFGTQTFRAPSMVLKTDATAYTATNTTTDAISVTIQPWILTAGKSIKITVSGNITGTNAAKGVRLYIDDAQICSLNTASANAGNYVAQFILMSTGAAAQLTNGLLAVNAVAPIVAIASDTTNFTTAPRVVKVQIVSANAGDEITATLGVMELLP